MAAGDPRRLLPRMDDLLRLPELTDAQVSPQRVRRIISETLDAARSGRLALPTDPTRADVRQAIIAAIVQRLNRSAPSSLTPVINATGVIVHTNLGRAPLSAAATHALVNAAGYVDVEMDLSTGRRSSQRGRGVTSALLEHLPEAEDAFIVGNGAGALMLTALALVGVGGKVVISRGELIEIGAGFRLPELLTAAGIDLVEVGATNRTHRADYERALELLPDATPAAILKVHPSNYRVEGFHSEVEVPELRQIAERFAVPVICDVGSGLIHPEPLLPDEPAIATALSSGADVVIASGDKLFGGPQAGIIAGTAEMVAAIRTHPLARAVRVDKLTLAAFEATLTGPQAPPALSFVRVRPEDLRRRTQRLRDVLGTGEVIEHAGRVGGGGAPEHPLPGWALALPEDVTARLRTPDPHAGHAVVVARSHRGQCLIDLRCVDPEHEDALIDALRAALS